MKKTGKNIISLLLFILPIFSFGQEINFYTSVDKNPVSTDDTFKFTMVLENARGEIYPPDLSDFITVFGPARSNSYQIINGQQTSSYSLSYTLRPKSTGTFTIPGATAEVNGRRITSESIKLEVIQGSSRSAGSVGGRNNTSPTQAENKNLLVRILLSKNKVYQGESVVATYVLYSRYNNIQLGEISFPTMTGFWKEDIISESTNWESQMEIINGITYRKAILKQQVLFPQRSGTIEIEAMTLDSRVNRSFFNAGTQISASSNSPELVVVPLPDPKPKDFNGAVGQFDFSATIDRTTLKANEAANLSVKVSGRGNLKLISDPEITFPDDFEVYDPEITDKISVNAGGTTGSRTYEYLIIPRFKGEYTVGPINFVYFDPSAGDYKTISSQTFNFNVEVGDNTGATYSNQRTKSTVSVTENNIRYIKENSDNLRAKGNWFFGSSGFYALFFLPGLAFALLIIFRKRQSKLMGNTRVLKNKKANKVAKNRLKIAEKALNNNDSKLFYEEIFKALYGYLSDKLYIPASELSRDKIAARLNEASVSEEEQRQLFHTLDDCEMARFGPVEVKSESEFYKNTVELITKLEAQIK